MREGTASLGGVTTLDLHYRSAKAFLLAYASQLSMGELFLETPNPWPLATPLKLRLHVNGLVGDFPPFEVSAAVSWTRPGPIGPGQPAGMGISLLSTMDGGGERIDALVGQYTRTRIWVATADSAGRAILGRYLQSLMSCEIMEEAAIHARTEQTDPPSAPGATDPGALLHSVGAAAIDLAIVDLDAPRVASIESLIHELKSHELSSGAPIVVLAQSERDRTRAAALGVDEILPNPPSLQELQSAVMHVLSRPVAVTVSRAT